MTIRRSPILIRNKRPATAEDDHPRHLHPPLDLRYIRAGIEVNTDIRPVILDNWLKELTPVELAGEIAKYEADIAVIRGDSSCIEGTLELARLLKAADIITIAVGQHVSHVSAQKTDGWKDAFDFSILGDPEQATATLVGKLLKEHDLASLISENGKSFENSVALSVKDPDSLPTLNLEDGELMSYPFPFPVRGRPVKSWGYIQTAWGCPYSGTCRFCSEMVRKSTGSQLRARNPENVADEIATLLDRGVDAICFEDNSIMNSKTHFLALCDEVLKRKLKFRWIGSARADQLDEENVAAAAKTGAVLFKIGVESASPRIIELLGKDKSGNRWLDQVRSAYGNLSAHNIGSVALVMIGCPDETEDEVRSTMKLVRALGPDYVQAQIFCMYPDSVLYRELEGDDEQKETKATDKYHYDSPSSSVSQIDPTRLLNLQDEFYRRFYLRPRYILGHVFRFWRFYLASLATRQSFRGTLRKIRALAKW